MSDFQKIFRHQVFLFSFACQCALGINSDYFFGNIRVHSGSMPTLLVPNIDTIMVLVLTIPVS